MSELTFEYFTGGDIYELGNRTVPEEEIVSFAEQYDPQPFHIDKAAAKESMFGGLVASGWHTVAIMTELAVRNLFKDVTAAGGVGVDELRWPAPVKPGNTLFGEVRVIDTSPSTSYSDRGYVDFEMELTNSHDETVLAMANRQIIYRGSRPSK